MRRYTKSAVQSPPAPPAPTPEQDNPSPRVFTEGKTFAERKATQAATPSGSRLVSMGPTEFVQRDLKGGTIVRDAELFCDLDHTAKMYVRLDPGGPLHPLFSTQKTGTTTPLRPLRGSRFSRPVTGRQSAGAPSVARPVAVPNELFQDR